MKKDEKREIFNAIGLVTQLGLSMAASVFIGVIGGKYLDEWLNTSPWFLLAGVILGTASAFKVMYDIVIKRFLK